MVIYNWTARRSGAGLTVVGVDKDRKRVRLTRVDRIEADLGGPFAVTVAGRVELSGDYDMRLGGLDPIDDALAQAKLEAQP